MILAISRFRVANGTESDVAAAFLNRPRIVDSWPGFLGLETFRDVKDTTVFYLVTRWTDSAAFRAWHASPAHRASHAWMPAGLRLDPSYTRLVELERLSSPDSPDVFNLALDSAATIGRFLDRTRTVRVLRLALDGTVLFANEAVADTLGVEAPRLRGTAIFPHLTETDAQLLRRVLTGVQAADDVLALNFCNVDGHPLTLACQLQLTSEDCVILGEHEYEYDRTLQHHLLVANEDLAILARERHRATMAEQASRREAELANRTKDEALAVIAHEMRQPLNAATMALGVLEVCPDALDRVRPALARQLTQLTQLVDDLLDASRVIRGTIELQKRRVDLRQITDDSVELIRLVADKRRQHLAVSLGQDALEVDVDLGRFGQVLSNVLTNASRYTPNGGSISVAIERDASYGVIRVSDTGEGIAPEALGRLFDLFVRGNADTGGLGIGLAVAKRLIEMHGGVIVARSEGLGRGAEFHLKWPLATGPETSDIEEAVDRGPVDDVLGTSPVNPRPRLGV